MAGRALVTGFEPFGGEPRNPSLETARALDGRRIGGLDVVGRILPVSLAALPAALDELLADVRPDLVLSLGLGPVLAGLLRRYGHPMTLERMQRLQTAVEQPQRPRLHLVHG